MLSIQKKLIKFNFSSGNDIEYIVVHDTGNAGVGANALAHYNYFNGGDRQASAHYFVDDNNIIQLVEDTNASWHCGDGGMAYGIGNHNSIGIETCINSDGNYDAAINNTIDLVKYLMNKYNIDAEHVVRHYDASRKNCPQMMNQDGKWTKWYEFKSKLSEQVTPTNIYRVKKSWTDDKSQTGAFSNLDKAISMAKTNGLNVYDKNGAQVYTSNTDYDHSIPVEDSIYKVPNMPFYIENRPDGGMGIHLDRANYITFNPGSVSISWNDGKGNKGSKILNN